jgi:predicted transcriptional regulator
MAKILTKAEEQIMQVIWKLDKAFLREIIEALPNPKPHNNTVATILKILTEKEFIGIEVFGRTHQYYPLISKDAYSKSTMKNLGEGCGIQDTRCKILDTGCLLDQTKNNKQKTINKKRN